MLTQCHTFKINVQLKRSDKMNQRSRNICWTITKKPVETDEEFLSWVSSNDWLTNPLTSFTNIKYMVWEIEHGEEGGRLHVQGYTEFKNPITWSAIKRDADTQYIHLEKRLGTAQQASDYCKKEGHFHEYGELSDTRTQEKHQEQKARFNEMRNKVRLLSDEEWQEEYPREYVIYNTWYTKERSKVEAERPLQAFDGDLKDRNLWIWGVAGCGKSKYCYDHYPLAYWKPANKWWDGYKGQDEVVLDDIDPETCKYLTRHIKIWADRYPFEAEFKGSSKKIRPKTFIITSNYSIEDCFPTETERATMNRRFKVIHMGEPTPPAHPMWLPPELPTLPLTPTQELPSPPIIQRRPLLTRELSFEIFGTCKKI